MDLLNGVAFNEPLLEDLLGQKPFDRGGIVLSMLFLNPGRHAGDGGDIDAICEAAARRYPDLRIHKTPLVGESPELVRILEQRMHAPPFIRI